MNTDADLIQRLGRSKSITNLKQAFGDSMGLPLTLRALEFWQLAHRSQPERVAPTGEVIAFDLAEKLLNKGSQRAAEQGLTNVTNIEFRRADSKACLFLIETFDAVLCVFGIFFVTDLQGGIRELWRLVRPNGLLAITIWGRGLFEPADMVSRVVGKTDTEPETAMLAKR